MPNPVYDGRVISLARPHQSLSFKQEGDWFDVHGEVNVGEHSIPFWKIADCIKRGERIYALPDGNAFLIPIEWMTKFRPLAQWSKHNADGAIRLARNQQEILRPLEFTNQEDLPALHQEDESIIPSLLLKAELRPYQLDGFRWLVSLYQADLGGCLADDMGLGKTLQSIAVLLYAKEQKHLRTPQVETAVSIQADLFQSFIAASGSTPLHALLVLPASLIFNWRQELLKFAPSLQVYVHIGNKRFKSEFYMRGFDIILTTYQTALKDIEILKKMQFEYVLLDESQQIKNKGSKVFGAVNELPAKHKLSLTGTPIENSLADLWSQMQFINPNLLRSFEFFKREFIVPIEKLGDKGRAATLRDLVKPYILRRTKEMVASDLPELTIQIFYTEMNEEQRKMYDAEKSAVRNFLLANYKEGDIKVRAEVIRALLRLRQLANHPALLPEFQKSDMPAPDSGKFDDMAHQLETVIKSGHKALLFSQFVMHLNIWKAYLDKEQIPYSILTGESSQAERLQAVTEFENNPEVKVFLISIKAGGTGLNLTAADYVFIADPWWNPAVEAQAIARAHRIGQTKAVFATKFIAKDTVEEKILKLQERKKELADGFIEDETKFSLNKNELLFLVE